MPRAFKLMLAYAAMVVPLLVVAAVIWAFIAPDRFYHCWDDTPLTFIPPFVHPEFKLNERVRDYFILPPKMVYGIWFAFVGVAAVVPVVVLAAFVRLWSFYERRGLFSRNAKSDFFRTM